MKFNTVAPTVETSSKELEEKLFSIGDSGIVFDVLRSKMYSNPISAICREISCNARDAHREVGTPDLPIEIYLPNIIEPYFKIKDFGPGISPDRIENIYIKYGSSSKRNDDLQTGMYGLGAKTPFSYSDTFTIITVHDNIKYNYSCIIDETKVGKLILLDKAPTDDYNGTEIIIPVKPSDFKSFIQWIEQSTRHWNIKPLFKGGLIEYKTYKKILSGNKWDLLENNCYNDSAIRFIIDDIEYQIGKDTLSSFINNDLLFSTHNSVFQLYFDIGDLSLSANREQVFLDKKTKDKIKQKIDFMSLDIKSTLLSKIDKCENYWDALVLFSRELNAYFNAPKFIGAVTWKGLTLYNNYIQLTDSIVYNYSKGSYRKLSSNVEKLTRYTSMSIDFSKDSLLIINDLFIKDPSSKHFRSLMLDLLKDKRKILLISPAGQNDLDKLNLKYNLDKMAYCLLSSICKKPLKKSISLTNKLIVYKVGIGNVIQVPYASLKSDNNKKVLCSFRKSHNNKTILLKNNKMLHESDLLSLAVKQTSHSFYMISESVSEELIKKAFVGYQSLDSFFVDKFKEFEDGPLMKIAYYNDYMNSGYRGDHNHHRYIPYDFDDDCYRKKIKDGNLIIKFMDLGKELRGVYEEYKHIMKLYVHIVKPVDKTSVLNWIKNNHNYDIVKILDEMSKKYKILKVLELYSTNNDVVDSIIEFVNLIDEKELKNV